MSESHKQIDEPTNQFASHSYIPKHSPQSVHTADLLNPGRSTDLDNIIKADGEIMKTYDLTEDNLKNLKQLRKYSLVIRFRY